MRWKGRERSTNVEDRRGRPGRRVAMGGGGVGVLVIVVVAMFLGADPREIVQLLGDARPAAQAGGGAGGAAAPAADDDVREFVEVVLHDTEAVWGRLFQRHVQGGGYQPPRLVLFSDSVNSACGSASAAMGPFYCPADRQVYIDPTFFHDLARRHRAPGDFAQAYVIAHEVAHHVQNLLGFSNRVHQVRQQGNQGASNRASVRLELQADFLAGVWAHHADKQYDILDDGDLEEAINAANRIGDDTLQRQSQGYVVPERYTHGTSAQRVRWFRAGFESGDLNKCNMLFDLDYRRL